MDGRLKSELEQKMASMVIEYRFQLSEDENYLHRLEIDYETLQLVNPGQTSLPDWTRLTHHQCANCPLDPQSVPVCPAAVNMVDLVESFDQLLSYDKITVTVVTADRRTQSHTTVQHGVCSLMGLLMATSNCPLTAFFKPMARFHLPFASTEETIWRATSTYVMSQYYLYHEGSAPDVTFEGLSHMYGEIQTVNMAFAKRLRSACQHDSMVNAIILLDMFAKSMPTAIEESLEEIRLPFLPYLSQIQQNKSGNSAL